MGAWKVPPGSTLASISIFPTSDSTLRRHPDLILFTRILLRSPDLTCVLMAASKPKLDRFPTTQWSAVEQAGVTSEDAAAAGLARLLPRYLGPLRAHLTHHKRMPVEQAEELLQAFMAEKVLERDLVASAQREKGRFRTFLLVALDRFVSNQLRNQQRQRRTPDRHAPLDDAAGIAAGGPSPSGVYEIAWARQVLADAAQRMREECQVSGRPDIWTVFEARVLAPSLSGADAIPHEQLALQLGLADTEVATNLLVTAKRMFARKLRGVIGEYMSEDGQIAQEIADLRAILTGGRE
jgi:DNA-directed RNA polymerase specialized sigma24 family protein